MEDIRAPEITPNDSGRALEQFQASRDTLFEVSEARCQPAPNPMAFDLVPDQFVGVEFQGEYGGRINIRRRPPLKATYV